MGNIIDFVLAFLPQNRLKEKLDGTTPECYEEPLLTTFF
jgi:hypothetical protein